MELKIVIQWRIGYPTWAVESLIQGEVLPSEGQVVVSSSPEEPTWQLVRRIAMSIILNEKEEVVTQRPTGMICKFGPVYLKESTYLRIVRFADLSELEQVELVDRLVHSIIEPDQADELLGKLPKASL